MMPKPISSSISRLTAISLTLMLWLTTAAAQPTANGLQESDTVPLFRGVAVSVDVVGAAQLVFSSYGQYEAALRLNLRDRYFPIVEVGLGKADADDVSSHLRYTTSAPYAKAGVDFNLMRNKHDAYRVYGGMRYAFTSFKFDVEGEGITDPVWGDNVDYSRTGIKASYHWLEAVFGVDAKLWGPVRLGWSLRYRRRLFHDDGEMGNTWYVPGYGKQGSSRLGGTFNLIFEL